MNPTNSTRKLTRPRKLRTSGNSNTRNDKSTCLHICLRVIFIGAVVVSLFSVYLSSVFTTYINGPNHSDTDYHLSFAPIIKSIPKTENNIFAAFQRLMNEYRDDDTTIKVPTASPTTEGPTTSLPTTDAPTGGTTATEVPEATDTNADADTTTKAGTTNSLSRTVYVSTTGRASAPAPVPSVPGQPKAPGEQPKAATNAPTTLPTSGVTDTAEAVTNTTAMITSSKTTPQQQPENATIAPTSEDTQDGMGFGPGPIVAPNRLHGSPVNDDLRNILAKTRNEFKIKNKGRRKREREFRRTQVDDTPERAPPKITTHPPENVWLINESGDLTSATKRRNRPQKRIPKILTKVYIQHSGTLTDPTDMNEALFRAHRSWKKMNPDVKVQYFDHRSARDYLQKHFHYSFLKTYDCLQPYSYKADFFRMAVVYREGGWYSDWKQECLQPNLMNTISNNGKRDLVLFYGRPADERLQTAFFGAKQRHDVMARMLARTMKNVYSRSYKGDAWKITGPAALRTAFRGSARMNVANWKDHVIGTFEPDNGMWFFVFNETRVVQHKCNDCNEGEEGNHNWAKGNNYVKMFMRKTVYCPDHRYIYDPPEA